MIRISLTLTLIVAFGFTLSAQEKKKPTKEMLIGAWKLTKSEEMEPGMVITTTFAKDGTLTLDAAYNGATMTAKGTWELMPEKEKIKISIKTAQGKATDEELTIVKLDDKILITKDSKRMTDEFEKAK